MLPEQILVSENKLRRFLEKKTQTSPQCAPRESYLVILTSSQYYQGELLLN